MTLLRVGKPPLPHSEQTRFSGSSGGFSCLAVGARCSRGAWVSSCVARCDLEPKALWQVPH